MYRNRPSISDHYREAYKRIRAEILHESDEQIIGSGVEKLAGYCFDKYALSQIEFDGSRETYWQHETYVKRIPSHQREEFYRHDGDIDWPCEKITVEIPIKPNNDIQTIANLQSSTWSPSFSADDFNFGQDAISFVLNVKDYGYAMEEEQIAQQIESNIERVKQLVGWKNADIYRENNELVKQIRKLINQKREDIEKNKTKLQALTKKINIPLKKKAGPGARIIRVDHKPIIKRIKPAPTLPEEYVLDAQKLSDIIEVLDGQAKTFEKTPGSLTSLGEEALRDLLLSNLNSIFEGKATGETFSKKGKTDIYLNIDKGNILIFECKIWGGKKLYADTIAQLRRYLTWRQNYGVIITFNRNKNFTSILKEAGSFIQESPSYINGFLAINETHLVSNHNLEGDEKQVQIHHLFYNLYSK